MTYIWPSGKPYTGWLKLNDKSLWWCVKGKLKQKIYP